MTQRRIPNILTPAEQARLLKQPNRRYPTGQRNRLLIKMMLDTGLRLSEAIALRWENVDLSVGRLLVKEGKGGKDAFLWTNEENITALQEWRVRQAAVFTERQNEGRPAYVFASLDGTPLGPRYVRRMVERYALKAGLEKHVYPHLLRHCFATDLLRATRNLRIVQRAGRWADISTVQIYAHIVDEEVEGAMRDFRKQEVASSNL